MITKIREKKIVMPLSQSKKENPLELLFMKIVKKTKYITTFVN
jgi:hypothetical protein